MKRNEEEIEIKIKLDKDLYRFLKSEANIHNCDIEYMIKLCIMMRYLNKYR